MQDRVLWHIRALFFATAPDGQIGLRLLAVELQDFRQSASGRQGHTNTLSRKGRQARGSTVMKSPRKAVAIISGGLDSVTLGYFLQREGYTLDVLSFDYGQRHHKELHFAEEAAHALNAQWICLDLKRAGIKAVFQGSALIDDTLAIPPGRGEAANRRATFVPNRNAIMLSIAFAAAASTGAAIVALAVSAIDHLTPDCRPAFLSAFEHMQQLALDGAASVRLEAPFQHKRKADIVTLGCELGVPFARTWSCYAGEDVHCGTCLTCCERREAFELAGVADPTIYKRR